MGGWIAVFLMAVVAYALSGYGIDWVMSGLIVVSLVMMLNRRKET
jgi:hypothetical protein